MSIGYQLFLYTDANPTRTWYLLFQSKCFWYLLVLSFLTNLQESVNLVKIGVSHILLSWFGFGISHGFGSHLAWYRYSDFLQLTPLLHPFTYPLTDTLPLPIFGSCSRARSTTVTATIWWASPTRPSVSAGQATCGSTASTTSTTWARR